jgi:hypothetical protein
MSSLGRNPGIVPPYMTRHVEFERKVQNGLMLATRFPRRYILWARWHPLAAREVEARLHTNPGPLPTFPTAR